MIKKFWLIWARTLDHRVGKTDEDEPNIPILSLKEARYSLILRTIIVVLNMVTCLFIIANIIKNW
tara:strand:- start:3089 stop:3283 length:195 start_codon:yes stop_codon:yes gene_type:complete